MNADLRLAGAALGAWIAALGCRYGTVRVDLVVAVGLIALAAVTGSVRPVTRWAARRPARPDRRVGSGAEVIRAQDASRRRSVRRDRRVGSGAEVIRAREAARWSPVGQLRWIVLAILLGGICAAAVTAARVATRESQPFAGLAARHAPVTLHLTVSDDPSPVRSAGNRPSAYVLRARAQRLTGAGPDVQLHADVLVLANGPGWAELLPGSEVAAAGRLLPPRGGDLTAAVLSTSQPPTLEHSPPAIQRAAGALRAGLRRACADLPAGPRGLLPGLVDGDTSGLDPTVAADFRATGMTHLVAVSGANVAIVLNAVLFLARWCRAGPGVAAGVCLAALAGFVVLARPSPSVLRAAVMGGLGLLALAFGRPRAAVPALSATALLLILVDPALAGTAGFVLSVLATAGLLLLAPPLRDALRRRRVPAVLAEALAVPVAAHLACAPVIAGMSGTVSLSAIPANLFAEPAVTPATILGVLATVVSVVWPGGAAFLAWLGSWPARWLVAVARYGAGVPVGVLAWPGGTGGALLLAGVVVGLLVVTRRRVVRVVAVLCAVAAAVGAVPIRLLAAGWPPSGALVVACDVGQGDGIVLPLPGHAALVMDAGPEPVAIDRCLHELGVTRVALLVISHFHADHVGGIDGVFRQRRVEAIVADGYTEPEAGYEHVVAVARAHGTPMSEVGLGWSWSDGPLRVTVIGPVDRLTGTDSDPNNNSLVLVADHAGVRILLPGDAEVAEQQEILSTIGPAALRAEVLKVPHHGSAYQDEPFLAAVRPRAALVSVGTGNSYGHPSVATLARLQRAGARVLRTDLDGDIAVVLDGSGLATVRHGSDPGRRPP